MSLAFRVSMTRFFPVALALVLAAAACGRSTSPATPAATAKTDTFNGTVAVGGLDFHPFTVATAGQVNVTLTSAGPPSTITMGIGVGLITGATCTIVAGGSVNTPAGASAQLNGTVSPGTYCVQVFDIGNQTASVTYTVTVNHS